MYLTAVGRPIQLIAQCHFFCSFLTFLDSFEYLFYSKGLLRIDIGCSMRLRGAEEVFSNHCMFLDQIYIFSCQLSPVETIFSRGSLCHLFTLVL